MRSIITSAVLLIAFQQLHAQEVTNKQKEKIGIPTKGELAYSKDQAFLAVSFNDAVHLYAAESFDLSRKLEGHSKPVTSVSFSPDGKLLLSTSEDKKAILWDYVKGSKEAEVPLPDEIIGGRMINNTTAALITNSKLIVCDLAARKVLYQKQEHTKPIRSVAISPEGKSILTGAGDGLVIEYDPLTGDVKRK